MRIIAGSRARMSLIPPADERTTRPITDRVKESLFSILQYEFPDAYVADLFCGTGSMGLEALSRGARHAVMVDYDADAIKRLRHNIAKLRFETETTVVRANIFKSGIPETTFHEQSSETIVLCTLVFVDPPYRDSTEVHAASKLGQLLDRIAAQIAPKAVVVVRQEKHSPQPLETYRTLHMEQVREYGSMKLSFLRNE